MPPLNTPVHEHRTASTCYFFDVRRRMQFIELYTRAGPYLLCLLPNSVSDWLILPGFSHGNSMPNSMLLLGVFPGRRF